MALRATQTKFDTADAPKSAFSTGKYPETDLIGGYPECAIIIGDVGHPRHLSLGHGFSRPF